MPERDARLGRLRDVKIELKDSSVEQVESEIIKGRILDAAMQDLRQRPGFNPAAISIVFGLKW